MPSKTLVSIVAQQARYAGNVLISIDRGLDSVVIQDAEGDRDSIFFEGETAHEIIKEADELWDEVRYLSWHDCCKAICAPYIETFWN